MTNKIQKQKEPLVQSMSFLGVLFLLFSFGTLISVQIGIGLLVFVATTVGFLGYWMPVRIESFKNLWFDKVLIEVHCIFIFISILTGLYFLCFLRNSYKIIKIEKNG